MHAYTKKTAMQKKDKKKQTITASNISMTYKDCDTML